MTRNSVAQSSTGSSCLRPSSLICLTLFLPVQPRRSDLHPDFFLVRLVERNLLYRSSSSVFFLHSLAFIKQTGQNMQEWYKAAKADKGLNLPPRALSLLRLCEVTPRRDFGSHHCVSGEVNFCQLRPSGAQILLSGSRRHVLGITRAQRTEGRRASPRLVNTVSALSLSVTQIPNRCKVHLQCWQMQGFTLIGKHTSSPPRPPSCRSLVYSQAALYFHPPCPRISSLWASPPLFFFFFYSYHRHLFSFSFFLFTDFLHPLSLSYFIWLRKTKAKIYKK